MLNQRPFTQNPLDLSILRRHSIACDSPANPLLPTTRTTMLSPPAVQPPPIPPTSPPPLAPTLAYHQHVRFDSQPRVTFYLTLVFELRGDTGRYMYSIDRCYTSLPQANERLKLLSRCNTNVSAPVRETIHAGEDPITGCQWCTWSRPGAEAGKFRFFAEVKKVVMHGSIRRDGPSETDVAPSGVGGGLVSEAESKYLFEHKKDLAGHVWVVAMHFPEKYQKISVDETGRPVSLPWILESVQEASGNAMGRAKRLWREEMVQKEGTFDRLDLHYGFARYLLVPLRASMGLNGGKRLSIGGVQRGLAWNTTAQIRVERIKVVEEKEMLAMFAPQQAILYDKPFRPLRQKGKDGRRSADVRAELLDLFDVAGEKPEDVFGDNQVIDLSSLVPPPMRDVSLMSFQDVLRPGATHEDGQYSDDISSLAPSSTRQPSSHSSQRTFRPNLVQEYGQLATMLRDPVPARTRSGFRSRGARDPRSLGTVRRKSMVSVRKKLYNSMVGEPAISRLEESGSPQAKDKEKEKPRKHSRAPAIYDSIGVPLETPGQVALAARQTLLMASLANRG